MKPENYIEQKKNSREWLGYVRLMQETPTLFTPNEYLTIETDLEKIVQFELEHHKTIGVIYQSRFNMWIVDLVFNQQGHYYTFERCVPFVRNGAVVSVPVYQNQFVLLNQFRHSIRQFQYAFPRGYGEPGITAEENLKKEIREELDAEVLQYRKIGEVVSNSGLSADRAAVFHCEITEPKLKSGYEEIKSMILLSPSQIKEWIAENRLTDGFTLSALCLYFSHQ